MKKILSFRHILFFILLVVSSHPLAGFEQPIQDDIETSKPASNKIKDSSLNNAGHPGNENEPLAAADTTAAIIPKPAPLEPIPTVDPDPLIALDALVTKQQLQITPYVPLIQEIYIGINYGMLATNAWQAIRKLKNKDLQQEHQYEGDFGLLFRKNIQLSSSLGYAHLHPEHTSDNTHRYTVKGLYGRIGLDYVIRYGTRDHLYVGGRYGRSHFTNTTQTSANISQHLTASWFELVMGAETQLWKNYGLYAGLALHLRSLIHHSEFKPANNYVIPGYGRTKNRPSVGLTLYIQYNLSFLNRLIAFN